MDVVNEFENCINNKAKSPYNVIHDVKKTYKEMFLIELNEITKKDGGSGKNKIRLANVIVL